jgi:(p)ppGpp synthase/HD superfamily hydrolase
MTIPILRSKFKAFDAIYELALSDRGHGLQKRWHGEPYMTHIDAVVLGVYKRISGDSGALHSYYELFLCVAAGHDLLEDTKISELEIREAIKDKLPFKGNEEQVVSGIIAITKKSKGEEEYVDYLKRVNIHAAARIAKIADLQHNISDLKPSNQRDKYNLSIFILERNLLNDQY